MKLRSALIRESSGNLPNDLVITQTEHLEGQYVNKIIFRGAYPASRGPELKKLRDIDWQVSGDRSPRGRAGTSPVAERNGDFGYWQYWRR